MLLVHESSPLLSRDLCTRCSLFPTLPPFSSHSSTITPSEATLAGLNATTAQMALMEASPGSVVPPVCPEASLKLVCEQWSGAKAGHLPGDDSAMVSSCQKMCFFLVLLLLGSQSFLVRLVCDCEQWLCPVALDLRTLFRGLRDILEGQKPSVGL